MKRIAAPLLWLASWAPGRLPGGAHWLPGRARQWWLTVRFAALARFPRDFETRIEPEGLTYRGNTRDVIQRSVAVYGVWEPDITEWMRGFVSEGDTAVDVGANTGYYSLILARRVGPRGKVVSVEPVPSIQSLLTDNINVNHLENIDVVRGALGAVTGEIEIFRAASANIGNSGTRWEQGHTSEGLVPVHTADELFAASAPGIRLVKIDTEGDEVAVLLGMRRTLMGMPAGSAVLVEVTPEKLRLREESGTSVWDLFETLGWSVHRIRNDYRFAAYAARRPPELVPVTALPTARCDLVFVKPAASSDA